jgi:hypothetical protein
MTYITKIVNVETGEEIERDMDEKEILQLETDRADIAAKETEKEAKAKANAKNKEALLERLGITSDEAALLLS